MEIGYQPDSLVVYLSRNAGFSQTLQVTDPTTGDPFSYPAGATVTLEIESSSGVTTWSATLTGANAVFNQTATQVNAILDVKGPKEARLYYDESGSEPNLWAKGHVREYD